MAIAFVVETGTGSATATSYSSVAQLEGYMDSFGYTRSAETTGTLQIKLNKATKYIDGTYANRFPGWRAEDAQALEWPRDAAYYRDGVEISATAIPPELINATCAAAALISTGIDLSPTIVDASIKSEAVTIGPISESKEYVTGRGGATPTAYYVINELQRIVGSMGAGSMRVTRA